MSLTKKLLQAAAGNAGESLYVEDVFSTYLYTGNGTSQTITNDIDLDGEGGLVWFKSRTDDGSNVVVDTERGGDYQIYTNYDMDQDYLPSRAIGFNSNGFSVSADIYNTNKSGQNYASWTFRKAEKFFDVVTYTGTGSATTISHNLDSVPGCIIIKRTDGRQNWWVYHRSLDSTSPDDYYITLNLTDARTASGVLWNSTQPTSSVFTVDSSANVSSATYAAYLFAHDAGGFGDDGSESIIKCGSFTAASGTGTTSVSLGWEPEFILLKAASTTGNWLLVDSMRGIPTGGSSDRRLVPNATAVEADSQVCNLTADGFDAISGGALTASADYIYIAIRRPMKTPESGTEVFGITPEDGTDRPTYKVPFVADMAIRRDTDVVNSNIVVSRLQGDNQMDTDNTSAESAYVITGWDYMDGWGDFGSSLDTSSLAYMFKRAPGFMDVVCYEGTGSAHAENHGLGVVPELIIIKDRDGTTDWCVYAGDETDHLHLNKTDATDDDNRFWNDTAPTSSEFTVGVLSANNQSGVNYIAILFATLDGISKVGSYTGTGSNVTVDCGFSSGAAFVLVKRTDSTGDWYLWDSERGIVAGDDPYLLLNSTATEVTNTDYIDPDSSGFIITSSAPAALNASGGNYIFLAIAA